MLCWNLRDNELAVTRLTRVTEVCSLGIDEETNEGDELISLRLLSCFLNQCHQSL